jgi:hypothetical protein
MPGIPAFSVLSGFLITPQVAVENGSPPLLGPGLDAAVNIEGACGARDETGLCSRQPVVCTKGAALQI